MGTLDNSMSKPMAARSREALAGMHRSHCCWIHGCKYGGYDCPVTDPEIKLAQDYPCEACDDEMPGLYESAQAANDAYEAGRRVGRAEGARHGFAEGSFRGFRQGRVFAETGRLETLWEFPNDMEVTDEMVAAFGHAWQTADAVSMPRGSGARRRAGLEAVLAILRRDVSGEGRS